VQVADASTTRGHEATSDATPTPSAPSTPESPSAAQSILTGIWNAVPGTHYSALAAQALHRGDYVQFGLYEAAATLEAVLVLAPGAGAVSNGAEAVSAEAGAALEALTPGERRAIQLAANDLAGRAFENQVGARLAAQLVEVGDQVTVVTASGVRTRLDFMFRDPTSGAIRCIEAKSSRTAGLTPNQEAAFPEIRQRGRRLWVRGSLASRAGLGFHRPRSKWSSPTT
jgi:hypothetical protein